MAHALTPIGKDGAVDIAVGLFMAHSLSPIGKGRAVGIAVVLFNGTCIISSRKISCC